MLNWYYLGQVLTWFQGVSDLKINLRKCENIPVREVNDIGVLSQVLNCRVVALLITYLGVPSGALNKDHMVWNSVLQRVKKRLARWQKILVQRRKRSDQ